MSSLDPSDPLVSGILKLLSEEPMSGLALSKALGAAPASTYARLNKLLSEGVIMKRRSGNRVVYALTPHVVEYLSSADRTKTGISPVLEIRAKEEAGWDKPRRWSARAAFYGLIVGGILAAGYAGLSAFVREMPLRILGGLLVASFFWALAAWLSSKLG